MAPAASSRRSSASSWSTWCWKPFASFETEIVMRKEILIALRATFVTLILTGLLYPLVMTGVAQALFAHQAGGSLVRDDKGVVVGSELIGQGFTNPAYLQGRPSAAGHRAHATSGGGSTRAPTSKRRRDRVVAERDRLHKKNPEAPLPIPAELVTTSASGLDPELSPEAAQWQVARIAKARQVTPDRIRAVIVARVQGRAPGVFCEPRVHVLSVHLAAVQRFGKP